MKKSIIVALAAPLMLSSVAQADLGQTFAQSSSYLGPYYYSSTDDFGTPQMQWDFTGGPTGGGCTIAEQYNSHNVCVRQVIIIRGFNTHNPQRQLFPFIENVLQNNYDKAEWQYAGNNYWVTADQVCRAFAIYQTDGIVKLQIDYK